MGPRTRLTARIALLALLPLSFGSAQVLQSDDNSITQSQRERLIRKRAVERHFESIEPRPRPQFDGAVPGSALLEAHRLAAAKVQERVRASLGAKPRATPEGATALSGILLRPAIPAGELPTSVVTGDFNGDRKMDFIVANGITNNLWLYLGNGDGTFQLPQIIPLSKGLSPVALAAASLRNNGILDLVVAEAGSSTIGVLLGNGNGTFGNETEYAVPEPPESVVIDDFHHSGKLDIAAAIDGTTAYIALLTGDGKGNFGTPVISNNGIFPSSAWNIASGDVNGDGLPDLLITGPGYENSQIFLNNGDGTFTPGQTVMENGGFDSLVDGRLGDVNGDGCLDVVVADQFTEAWVALGDCSGKFSAPVPVYMGVNNAAVRLADVNGDGHLDIITSAFAGFSDARLGMYGGDSISVALGDGEGNFSTARQYTGTGQAYSIGTADFTGKGTLDVVTAESDSDTATIYKNDGTGGFGFPQGIYTGVLGAGAGSVNNPYSDLSFGDLNGTGKIDAFFVDEGLKGEFYATSFLNDGTGKFTGPINTDMGIAITNYMVDDYRLGNFRNTGKLDLVAIGFNLAISSSTPSILFMAGNGDGTFAAGTPVTAAGADGILTTGDFNGDGKLDFVAVNGTNTHTLTMFVGNGDGTFHALAPVTFTDPGDTIGGTYSSRIYTGDFNRDGKLDVLVFTTGNGYGTTASTVWEFDGNGDGTFQTPRQIFTDFQPFALADLTGNSYPDIVEYNSGSPNGTPEDVTFTNYLDQPGGSFTQSSTYSPYSGIPESVQPYLQNGDPLASSIAGAYSGDGKADEVAFQYQQGADGGVADYAQILMGNGDGTFTPTYDIFPFIGGYPGYATDLNGDGISDMVEVDSGTSSLHVFQGGAAPALQIALAEPIVTGNQGCGWVFPDVAPGPSENVALSSSVSGVTLPSSVTIPAGALSAEFCFTLTNSFNWRQVFDINATLNGSTATAYASDSYVLGFSEAVSPVTPATVYQGQSSAPLALTLTAQPGYSSTANLYCVGLAQGDSCQFGSNALSISPAGPASTTVTLETAVNAATYGNSHNFTIVADDGNVIQRQSANLGVATLELSTSSSFPISTSSPGGGASEFLVWGIPPYQFNCSGLPAGATCSFSGTQQPSGEIGVTVGVSSGVANGSYPFTVTATSQSYAASGPLTLQVVSFSIQGPSAGSNWVLPGTTKSIPISFQGSSNWAGESVTIGCSLDVASTCTGGIAAPGVAMSLSLSVPAGTSLGQHQLTVTGTLGGSTQTYTFPIYVVSLSGSLSSSTLTMTRGGSGTLTATLDASTGFSDVVTLGCSGASQLTCSFNPYEPQVTGGTEQTVTIILSASGTARLESEPANSPTRSTIALAGLFPLALCCGFLHKKWRNALLTSVLGIIAILFVGACGGGAGGGGGGGGGSNTYSLTVTAYPSGTSVTNSLGTVTVTVTH
jgi:hypothetical protein